MRSATFAWCLAVYVRADVPAEATAEDRELQAGGFGSDECLCPCSPDRDGRCPANEADWTKPEHCYKPVCEAGYYRCCSTCSMSVCANRFPMVRSRRNLFECLPCLPGDFCPGCDTRERCAPGTINTEPKMAEPTDCLPCDFTEKNNKERTQCCEAGNMLCIDPPRDPNFGSVISLLLPALFMLS